MKRLSLILAALVVLLMTSSCIHRGFDYDSGRLGYVEVVFDWRNAPEAQPESMVLFLFPREGGKPERYDFVGRNGGVIRVVPGVYDAICINSDKRDVIYRDPDNFNTFMVTTPVLSTATFGNEFQFRASDLPGTEGSVVMMQPPILWSSSEIGFEVTVRSTPLSKGAVSKGGESKTEIEHQVLTMYPKLIVDTYIVTVKNVRNNQYLRTMSGSINAMSDGYMAGPQMRTDTSVLLTFDLAHYQSIARAEGTFLTFGHCPGERRPHTLILYAILTDGSKHYYTFDVSDQAHNPPDENGIYHIVVEFIDLPEPSGSGMAPDVNQWNSTEIYLPM